MSTLTMVQAKKEATPAITSRLSATPQRHFELPRQVNPAVEAGTFDTTPAEPGFGYDFGRIPVHAPSLTSGDGATQRAAQSCPLAASPRACPFGGACHTCHVQVQAKLAISQPDDIYEQEADRVAEQVMRMPDPVADKSQPDMTIASVQTKRSVQWSAEDAPEIDDHLESRLRQSRGGGSPLPENIRAFMEPRFGFDFSQVRVHTGSEALNMNRALAAQAFTRGTDIYFAAGKYEPESVAGKHLLAHELTHVVQQTGGVQAKQLAQLSDVQMKCSACEAEEKMQRSIDIFSALGIIQRQPSDQPETTLEEDVEEEYSAESVDYEDIDYEETSEEDIEPAADSDSDLEDGDSPVNGTEEIGELSYEQAAEEDLAGEFSEVDEEGFETEGGEVFAKKEAKAPAKPKVKKKKAKAFIKHIEVNLSSQRMKLEWSDGRPPEGGILISSGKGCPNTKGDPCPSGDRKYCTPKLTNSKIGRRGSEGAEHKNSKGQPMPYYVELDSTRGIGIHKGKELGAPHSHGCIRTNMNTARRIYQNVNSQTTVTTTGKANTQSWGPLGRKETLDQWKDCPLPPERKKKKKK